MKQKIAQRFGKIEASFGDFGELRKQKKPPHVRVLYIPIVDQKLRSLQNAETGQIEHYIKSVGVSLAAKAISQENAEIVLDFAYQELHKRVNDLSQAKLPADTSTQET